MQPADEVTWPEAFGGLPEGGGSARAFKAVWGGVEEGLRQGPSEVGSQRRDRQKPLLLEPRNKAGLVGDTKDPLPLMPMNPPQNTEKDLEALRSSWTRPNLVSLVFADQPHSVWTARVPLQPNTLRAHGEQLAFSSKFECAPAALSESAPPSMCAPTPRRHAHSGEPGPLAERAAAASNPNVQGDLAATTASP